MTDHIFKRQQILPITINEAWDFFSDPRNLCKITPKSMDFKIISDVPRQIHEGLEVEYRVKPLLGIPTAWVSRIQDVKPPFQFVDLQLKGPYRYWHHHHSFEETAGGVMMKDMIIYRVPYDTFFPWLNDAVVVKELNKIFDFREQTLNNMFGVK